MHTLATASARIFLLYVSDAQVAAEVDGSLEPFRCVMDITRERGLHDLVDGSSQYHKVLDALETLICLDN